MARLPPRWPSGTLSRTVNGGNKHGQNPGHSRRRHEHARQGADRDFRQDDLARIRRANPRLCRGTRRRDRDIPFQHRGRGVNRLYAANDQGFDAAIFNPAGFSRGYPALTAAISQVSFPTIEVHISNPIRRGPVSDTAQVSQGSSPDLVSTATTWRCAAYGTCWRQKRDSARPQPNVPITARRSLRRQHPGAAPCPGDSRQRCHGEAA